MSLVRSTVAVIAGLCVSLVATNMIVLPALHWTWYQLSPFWVLRHEALAGYMGAGTAVLLVSVLSGATVGALVSGQAMRHALVTCALAAVIGAILGPRSVSFAALTRVVSFLLQAAIMATVAEAVFARRQPNESLQPTGDLR